MDLHDVFYTSPSEASAHRRGVDPELLRRQARGVARANQAKEIAQGSQLANALRMQNMEMPGVVGQGFAAQGPTFLQGLATMAANRQGQNKVNELEAQARALRGGDEDAILAELQAADENARLQRLADVEARDQTNRAQFGLADRNFNYDVDLEGLRQKHGLETLGAENTYQTERDKLLFGQNKELANHQTDLQQRIDEWRQDHHRENTATDFGNSRTLQNDLFGQQEKMAGLNFDYGLKTMGEQHRFTGERDATLHGYAAGEREKDRSHELDRDSQARLHDIMQTNVKQAHDIDVKNIMASVREEESRRRDAQVVGRHEAMVNPRTGEVYRGATRKNGKMTDADGNDIPNGNELIDFKDSPQAKRFGRDYKDLRASDAKTLMGSFEGIRDLNSIADVANRMEPQDLKALNNKAFLTLINSMAPGEWEAYAKNERWISGLSPLAKEYLERVAKFSAKVRHELYGSALTWSELQNGNAFMPTAIGLSKEDRDRRLGIYWESMAGKIKDIDDLNHTNFTARLPGYRGRANTVRGAGAGGSVMDLEDEVAQLRRQIADFLAE